VRIAILQGEDLRDLRKGFSGEKVPGIAGFMGRVGHVRGVIAGGICKCNGDRFLSPSFTTHKGYVQIRF
jgi:hypothetical protein